MIEDAYPDRRERTEDWRCIACGQANVGRRFEVQSARSLPAIVFALYGECTLCGSISLLDSIDPTPWYEADYERHRAIARTPQDNAATRAVGWLGSRVIGRFGAVEGRWIPRHLTWAAQFRGRVRLHDRVLDVGCGNGAQLAHLARFGFTQLLGIDPYLREPGISLGPVQLRRAQLATIVGPFTAIIFKHSLEHVDDPVVELELARERLAEGGIIVVDLPIAGGRAWQRFRDNWADLDAPLHRFLPSPDGMSRIAARAGLRVLRWDGSSAAHSYRNSLLIQNGANPATERPEDHLAPRLLAWCEAQAKSERGPDATQASFVLTK